MQITLLIAVIIFSYLLGNISWARIIASRKNIDITKQGSGNPGATNTLRTLGGKAGVTVFLLDIVKGAIPALVGVLAFGGYVHTDVPLLVTGTNESYLALYLCGLAAVLGHTLPAIHKFRGGKGIATMFGVFLIAQPILSAVLFVVCFCLLILLKYMSAISMMFIFALTIVQIVFAPANSHPLLYIALSSMILIVLIGHRTNLYRLFTGKENKTDLLKYFKKKKAQDEKIEEKDQKEVETKEPVQENKNEAVEVIELTQEIKENEVVILEEQSSITDEK